MSNRVKLAMNILHDHFGDLVEKVGECLLKEGVLTIVELIRKTKMTFQQVRNALLVLIQHNMVIFYDKLEKERRLKKIVRDKRDASDPDNFSTSKPNLGLMSFEKEREMNEKNKKWKRPNGAGVQSSSTGSSLLFDQEDDTVGGIGDGEELRQNTLETTFYYEILLDEVLMRLKCSKFIMLIKDRVGVNGELVMEELLEHGRLTNDQIVDVIAQKLYLQSPDAAQLSAASGGGTNVVASSLDDLNVDSSAMLLNSFKNSVQHAFDAMVRNRFLKRVPKYIHDVESQSGAFNKKSTTSSHGGTGSGSGSGSGGSSSNGSSSSSSGGAVKKNGSTTVVTSSKTLKETMREQQMLEMQQMEQQQAQQAQQNKRRANKRKQAASSSGQDSEETTSADVQKRKRRRNMLVDDETDDEDEVVNVSSPATTGATAATSATSNNGGAHPQQQQDESFFFNMPGMVPMPGTLLDPQQQQQLQFMQQQIQMQQMQIQMQMQMQQEMQIQMQQQQAMQMEQEQQKQQQQVQQQQQTKREDPILWMINFDQFVRTFRNEAITKYVSERINPTAAAIFRAILNLTSPYEKTKNDQISSIVHFDDIYRSVLASDEYHASQRNVEKYLDIMSQDSTRILQKMNSQSGGGSYVINLAGIVDKLKRQYAESIIEQKHGQVGCRIFRMLLMNKMMEQKQIAEFAMIPMPEARTLLYKMLQDEVVELQEVPKHSDYVPSRTFYLWNVKLNLVYEKLTNNMYKTCRNLRSRLAKEQEDAVNATGGGFLTSMNNLSKEQQAFIHRLEKVEDRLESSLIHLNTLLMFFEDF